MINTKNILKTLLFLDKHTQLTSCDEYNGAYSISVEEIRQLCDHIDELEHKLKIAEEGLQSVMRLSSGSGVCRCPFGMCECCNCADYADEALKQIRGEE